MVLAKIGRTLVAVSRDVVVELVRTGRTLVAVSLDIVVELLFTITAVGLGTSVVISVMALVRIG